MDNNNNEIDDENEQEPNNECKKRIYKNRTLEYYDDDGNYDQRKYYRINKERFKKNCECGVVLTTTSSNAKHIRSKQHINKMEIIRLKKIIQDNNIEM